MKKVKKPKSLKDLDAKSLLNLETSGCVQAEGLEKTYRFSQEQILEQVPMQAAQKSFELSLPSSGPYKAEYSRSGSRFLLASKKGHIAMIEKESSKLTCEFDLHEIVRAVKWLREDDGLFALAQSRFVYIYDSKGVELHRLDKHQEIFHMEYLPFHYLLATIGSEGVLRYQDISTGNIVAQWDTKSSKSKCSGLNMMNGVLGVGHVSGAVTFWSPAIASPLVTMQCHKSPVNCMAFDSSGNYFATSGMDGNIKIWDLRTYKELSQLHPVRPATAITISQRNILAAAFGPHVSTWADVFMTRSKEPYLQHLLPGEHISSLSFCPFDDVLGIGHSAGFSSILIPGSGEPNYDSLAVNPFSSRKAQKEASVKALLEKLPVETIGLDRGIGSLASGPQTLEKACITQKTPRRLNGRKARRIKNSLNVVKDEKPVGHSTIQSFGPLNRFATLGD